jgi:hypothetical protein
MSDEFLMKGKVFGEHRHKLVYPLIAEIKYDEIRLHVKRFPQVGAPGLASYIPEHVEFLSYAGKPLCNLWHWADQFFAFMVEQGVHNLDMGVLVNGNFNDAYRWCRSSTGFPQEKLDKKTGKIAPALDESMVKFFLFDCPDSTLPFCTDTATVDLEDRRALRKHYRDGMQECGIPVETPQAYTIPSEAGLNALFAIVREEGYEGLMVKSREHTYQPGKRIDGWLKMKPESEADGKVVRINQAISIEGVPLDRAGSIDVEMEDGSIASPAGIPHELGALLWRHPYNYMGHWLQFKYMERDRAGGYRHPSFVRFREDK